MKVEIWSDVVCPWCFVGKKQFEKALAEFEHADDIQIVWRSYELDPRAPEVREGTYAERIARKYGIDVGQARAAMARIISVGAEAGIDFKFDDDAARQHVRCPPADPPRGHPRPARCGQGPVLHARRSTKAKQSAPATSSNAWLSKRVYPMTR